MKTDYQIQQDVMDQLKWEPVLNAAQIGVAVKNGVVTLSGTVDSYFKKLRAESATKKVAGVQAIAEDIQVGVSPAYKKSDSEIAQMVLTALKSHTSVPDEKIKVKVEDAVVTLEGVVEWDFQRKIAKEAISGLPGIKIINNNIMLKPVITPDNIKQRISSAFHRTANIDSGRINVEVTGTKVKLTGTVKSLSEKEDAVSAAWSAPGITEVQHTLKVEVPEFTYEE